MIVVVVVVAGVGVVVFATHGSQLSRETSPRVRVRAAPQR